MNNMDFQLTILCDVVNPFTGENGATMIYGPQKGATNAMVEELEAGMIHFLRIFYPKLQARITTSSRNRCSRRTRWSLTGILQRDIDFLELKQFWIRLDLNS